jgi:hypothetical protein
MLQILNNISWLQQKLNSSSPSYSDGVDDDSRIES